MAVGSDWLARQLPAMREFVVAHLRATRDRRRLEHPERTLASYVFQEAEGVSRAAKLWWARARGPVQRARAPIRPLLCARQPPSHAAAAACAPAPVHRASRETLLVRFPEAHARTRLQARSRSESPTFVDESRAPQLRFRTDETRFDS